MLRRAALRLAAGGISMLGAGCSWGRREPRRIRVASSPFLANCGFYVAYERGFFNELGFALDLSPATNAGQGAMLLVHGQLDVGLYTITPALVNMVAAGSPIRIVAAKTADTSGCSPPAGVVWRTGEYPRGLEGVRRLRGKRVGVSRRATSVEFWMDTILEAAGMSPTDIEPVYVGDAAAIGALEKGDLDALVTGAELSVGPTGVHPNLEIGLNLADVAPGAQLAFIEFGARVLDSDPSIGADFLAAYFRGVRAFRDGHDPEFVRQIVANGGAMAAEFQRMCREYLTLDGRVNRERVEQYIGWAVRKRYCEKAVPAEKIIDERYLTLAQQRQSRREGRG